MVSMQKQICFLQKGAKMQLFAKHYQWQTKRCQKNVLVSFLFCKQNINKEFAIPLYFWEFTNDFSVQLRFNEIK